MKTQNLKTPIIMLALNRSADLKTDREYAEQAMRGIAFEQVVGHYEGQKEPAYMIPLDRPLKQRERQINELLALAKLHNQECILYSDEYRQTMLIFCGDGSRVNVGKLVRITADQARELENYTYVPFAGTYWATQTKPL